MNNADFTKKKDILSNRRKGIYEKLLHVAYTENTALKCRDLHLSIEALKKDVKAFLLEYIVSKIDENYKEQDRNNIIIEIYSRLKKNLKLVNVLKLIQNPVPVEYLVKTQDIEHLMMEVELLERWIIEAEDYVPMLRRTLSADNKTPICLTN